MDGQNMPGIQMHVDLGRILMLTVFDSLPAESPSTMVTQLRTKNMCVRNDKFSNIGQALFEDHEFIENYTRHRDKGQDPKKLKNPTLEAYPRQHMEASSSIA